MALDAIQKLGDVVTDPFAPQAGDARFPGQPLPYGASSYTGQPADPPAGDWKSAYQAGGLSGGPRGQFGGGPIPPPPQNGMGTASLVCSLVGLLVPFILPVLAIVLGLVGCGRAKGGRATNKGMAITGIVIGVLVLGIDIYGVERLLSTPAHEQFVDCKAAAADQKAYDLCYQQYGERVGGGQP